MKKLTFEEEEEEEEELNGGKVYKVQTFEEEEDVGQKGGERSEEGRWRKRAAAELLITVARILTKKDEFWIDG